MTLMNKTTELSMNDQTPNALLEEATPEQQSQPVQNPQFHDVKYHLKLVTGLQEAHMYAAAINFLKKSLIILDEHISKSQDELVKIANQLLVEVHTQLGWCYFMVNENALSLSSTNKALGLDSKDARTMYLLAKNLLRCKEYLQGYGVLQEAKKIAIASMDDEYYGLIDDEMKKYEKRVKNLQAKKQAETTSTSAASSPGTSPFNSLSTIVDKEEALEKEKNIKTVKIGKKNVKKDVKEASNKGSSINAGMVYCFAGTVLSSSLGSWLLMKTSGNVSEKKSVVYSLGIGAVIGGVCAFVLGRNAQKPEKKEEKQDLNGSFFESIANS